jgi:hypothetical protein
MNFTNRTMTSSTRARLVSVCLSILSLPCLATAQDTRSTLTLLVDDSSVIVQARVLQVQTDGITRRVTFKTRQVLKGTSPATFELREPFQRSCGSALFGTLVGTSYVTFLTGEGSNLRLTVTTARALMPLAPKTLRHIRTLVSTKNSQQRLALAVAGLSSTSTRIRQDSAATLARAKLLTQLNRSERWQCLQALGKNLQGDDRVTMDLLQVVQRLEMKEAVDLLVPHYLTEPSGTLRNVLLETIPELDKSRAVRRLEQSMPSDIQGLKRGIALLSLCDDTAAHRCLDQLSTHRNQVVAAMAQAARLETAAVQTNREAFKRPIFRSILQPKRR